MTKKLKSLVAFVACAVMLLISVICVSAFQADGVHSYDMFSTDIDGHGYLYLLSYSNSITGGEACAETEITQRTSDITEVYVKYYFDEKNAAFANYLECYAPDGYRITPSWGNNVVHVRADYLYGVHRVTHRVDSTHYEYWEDITCEYDERGFER